MTTLEAARAGNDEGEGRTVIPDPSAESGIQMIFRILDSRFQPKRLARE